MLFIPDGIHNLSRAPSFEKKINDFPKKGNEILWQEWIDLNIKDKDDEGCALTIKN